MCEHKGRHLHMLRTSTFVSSQDLNSLRSINSANPSLVNQTNFSSVWRLWIIAPPRMYKSARRVIHAYYN